jgi:uncharacterized membrane protein YcaP (DUF421 family)
LTNAFIVVLTLVGLQVALSWIKQHSETVKRVTDGLPILLVENGRVLERNLGRERISEDAILEAARELQGLERMEQIMYAVLETTGTISIVPKQGEGG